MRYSLALLLTLFVGIPFTVHAATLSLDAEATTTPGVYTMNVILDSPESVNTIEATIVLPPGVTYRRMENDNPLGFYWIEAPRYDASTRTVHFSGMIPNGWHGTGGQVLSFSLSTLGTALFALTFDPTQTHMYKNDGVGSEEPLIFSPVRLRSPPGVLPVHALLFSLLLILLIGAVYFLHRRFRVTYQ